MDGKAWHGMALKHGSGMETTTMHSHQRIECLEHGICSRGLKISSSAGSRPFSILLVLHGKHEQYGLDSARQWYWNIPFSGVRIPLVFYYTI